MSSLSPYYYNALALHLRSGVRIFHSKMQFGVKLVLLRTPLPLLGGRVECAAEKKLVESLVDWGRCITFALATQKNGSSEVSEEP